MALTEIGQTLEKWSPSDKAELKEDIGKLIKIASETLRSVLEQIGRTYPACNTNEMAAIAAEQSGEASAEDWSDAVSAWAYLWSNMENDAPQAVSGDLVSLGLIPESALGLITDILSIAAQHRETALVVSRYIRVGAPLFVRISGVVDIRCRFHEKEQEFRLGKLPEKLIDTHPVIMANIVLNNQDDKERTFSFLMDENDLNAMKRFLRNMGKELELSKAFLKRGGDTVND
ncbi:MAG: hypothetical protein ACLQGT_05450 [Terracidiphilus sp.]